ncbi:hypothetical protein [Massilia sp. S19_KUP03_FR1]|uniref:hypothetical protein n=1 Tax=Massilia sp. S19_KUP03_FR1 TaxID=3025503 RepID=UPI002FCD6BC0
MKTSPGELVEREHCAEAYIKSESMEHGIGKSLKRHTLSNPNERREFKAGVGFYAVMIPFISIMAWFVFFVFRDGGGKGHIVFGGIIAYLNCIMTYDLLSRIPLWPWYRGPTLVVDNYGLKTEKWFISWSEIEKIDTFNGGRGIVCIGIVKKGQRSWEIPYLIEGPLGAKIRDVLRYLQVSKSDFTPD